MRTPPRKGQLSCPACGDYFFSDDQLGRMKCPECTTEIIIAIADGLKVIKEVPSMPRTERPHLGLSRAQRRVVGARVLIDATPADFHAVCIVCGTSLESSVSALGQKFAGMVKREFEKDVNGHLVTCFRMIPRYDTGRTHSQCVGGLSKVLIPCPTELALPEKADHSTMGFSYELHREDIGVRVDSAWMHGSLKRRG